MKKKFSIVIILFLLGVIIAGFISYSAVQKALRNKKIEDEVSSLKRQAEQIQKENDTLSQKIAYFQTPEFQEKVAKEKLNLQKPDEKVVVVKPEISQEVDRSPQIIQENQSEQKVANYKKWWNLFFKFN